MEDNLPEKVQMGMRIKKARETARLTQERLGEMLDVTAQYISGVERGAVGLSVPTLRRLCSILMVSSDYILTGQSKNFNVEGIAARLEGLPAKHLKNIEGIIELYLDGVLNSE